MEYDVTLNKLIFDLLNILRGGYIADDERVSFRQVEFWVANTRAMLIRQSVNKGDTIPETITQYLPCVDFEIVDRSSALDCRDIPVGCSINRTVDEIPVPIDSRKGDLILAVSCLDIATRDYTLMPNNRIRFVGHDKWVNNIPKAFYRNGRIYILNDPHVLKAEIVGVFGDPMDAARFTTCDGNPCITRDSKYPITRSMVEQLKQIIKANNFSIAMMPSDDKNDASGKVEMPQGGQKTQVGRNELGER